MQAITYSGTRGDPLQVLSLNQIPIPVPGAGQVLVRVIVSPIHPSTLAGVSPGGYPGPKKGECPGSEAVGVIEAHGPGCEEALPLKTRVLVFGSTGTWTKFVVLRAKGLIPVPDSVSDANAAQFFVNPLSALLLVTAAVTPQPGEWVLQTAAFSVLGRLIIQFSKIYGFKTINLVRSVDQVQPLLDLGADAVICTTTEDVALKIKELTQKKGVKYAIDCVGGDATTEVLKAMAYGGKLVVYGQLAKEEIHFQSGLLVLKLLTIQGFWLSDWLVSAPADERRKGITELMTLFATGKLDCPVDRVYPLEEFLAAIQQSTKQGKNGKVLLKCS